jgi:hypothetical protein
MTFLRHYIYAFLIKGWEHPESKRYASNMARIARRYRIERFGRV